MNTSNIIRDRRNELGLTLKEVADYVGVSEGTVSRWESGDIANMKRSRINSLAEVLNISPLVLIGQEKAPAENDKREVNDDDIKFALFGGDSEITDAMYDEVRQFAAFVKNREAQKKKEPK